MNIGKYEFKAHFICSEVFSFVVLGPAPSSAMCWCTNLVVFGAIAVNTRDA